MLTSTSSSSAPIILGTAAGAVAQLQKREPRITFPAQTMAGSLGDYARTMAEGTEVPAEFYFAAALTFFGATCGTRLKLNATLAVEPRLYTVLLGESADVKKSTALRNVAEFFRGIWQAMKGPLEDLAERPITPAVCNGVGSAEGLARVLQNGEFGVVLCCDELKALVEKSKIESSVLLPMLASLFEQSQYENATQKRSFKLDDAHLSIVGCCTTETYDGMWDQHSIAIGFPNRLFVVLADRKQKVSWPFPRDERKLEEIKKRIVEQVHRLPKSLDIEPDALAAWDKWYRELPASIHAKRLDSIGFRLMALIAVTNDKARIDLETVRCVLAILDYEFDVRMVTDPTDADNRIAELEQKVIKQLKVHGSLSRSQLWQFTNGARSGVFYFEAALNNLVKVGSILAETSVGRKNTKRYRLPELAGEDA